VGLVWQTLTEPELVAQWFAEEVDLLAKPGYDGRVTFNNEDTGHQPVTVDVSVESVDPERSYAFRWGHPAGTSAREDNSVLVVFTLLPSGEGTTLRVVESGLDRLGWSEQQQESYAEEHNRGWTTLLGRLETLLVRPRGHSSS